MPLDPSRRSRRSRLPLLLTAAGAVLVLLLWVGLQRAQRWRIEENTRLTAEQVTHRLTAWTDTRSAMLRFFADHCTVAEEDAAGFVATAEQLLSLYPGFQALNFIEPDGTIAVVFPREGNERALGRNVSAHPEVSVREAFARAQRSGALEVSGPITLYQGGRGLASYRAIRLADGRTTGYVNGVFRIDTLVDSCLWEEPLRANYRFRLRGPDGEPVYQHAAGEPEEGPWPLVAAHALPLFGQGWTLEVAPSSRMMARSETWTDDVLGLVGLALVVLVGWLLAAHFRRLEDLAESRARYQLLVENTADLIVKVDPQGRFLYLSPSCCALFGTTEAEQLGQELLPLVAQDGRAELERQLQGLKEPPHTGYLEHRSKTARGWRWLAWSLTAVRDAAGAVEAVIGVGRDATEQRELEAQLRHSQKLHEVGELAGGIAHDFNNILQALVGNLGFVRQSLGPNHPAQPDVDRVVKGVARATRLTRQLLAFSRRDALRARPTDVARLTGDLLDMIRPALGEGVSVTFSPGDAVPPAHVDPGALEQVVTNLCTNARDAVGGAGHVHIRTYTRELSAAEAARQPDATAGTWVVVEVSDDGVGLDPAIAPRIFEPFFTTKGRGRGTGLGLSTVYGIVRQHGGFVAVESTPGEGATFRVHLPPADGPAVAEAEPPPPPPPERPAGGTVLVAEDDESVRDFAVRALRRAGYEVVEAVDGAEAISRVEELGSRLDLALLDVVMPGTGGHEAARRLRELRPDLRIVFTSGYDPDAPALRDGRGVAAGLLSKPYTLELLLETVRTALSAAP